MGYWGGVITGFMCATILFVCAFFVTLDKVTRLEARQQRVEARLEEIDSHVEEYDLLMRTYQYFLEEFEGGE